MLSNVYNNVDLFFDVFLKILLFIFWFSNFLSLSRCRYVCKGEKSLWVAVGRK